MEKRPTNKAFLSSFKELQEKKVELDKVFKTSKEHLAVHDEKMEEHNKAAKRVEFLGVLLKNIMGGMKKWIDDKGLRHDPVLKTFIPQLRDFMRLTRKTLKHEYELSEELKKGIQTEFHHEEKTKMLNEFRGLHAKVGEMLDKIKKFHQLKEQK